MADKQPTIPNSEEVDNAIDAWHRSGDNFSLPVWLGWTEAEYSDWVSNPSKIPNRPLISRSRKPSAEAA